MALIKFKAEQGEEFDGYKPGDYVACITSIEPKKSQTNKRFYEITFSGKGFGTINARLFDTYYGRNDLFNIYTAIGIDPKRDDIEDTEILDRYLMLTIEEDGEYNGKPRWRPAKFRAVPSDDEDEDSFEAPSKKKQEEDDDDDW